MSKTTKKRARKGPTSKANGSKDPSAKKANSSKDPSATKESSGDFQLTGPRIDEETGEKMFSKEDLTQYELAQSRVVNAQQAARIKKYEADEYQRQANQKLASLQSQKKLLDVEAANRRAELKLLQDVVSAKYDIDLSQVTYDDETGRIMKPPTDAEESQPAA